MMKIRKGLIVFGAIVALSLTGCASAPDKTSDYNSDNLDSEDSTYDAPWSEDSTDLNSHIVTGENYVQTVTVTLNNGDTVECVVIESQLECFSETLVPAAPR